MSCPALRSTCDILVQNRSATRTLPRAETAIAEVPNRKTVNPRSNSGSQMDIQTCQPVADHILSRPGDIPTNLNHFTYCNL
jgi:hypothetical protein